MHPASGQIDHLCSEADIGSSLLPYSTYGNQYIYEGFHPSSLQIRLERLKVKHSVEQISYLTTLSAESLASSSLLVQSDTVESISNRYQAIYLYRKLNLTLW